jgi:hypothetical protein
MAGLLALSAGCGRTGASGAAPQGQGRIHSTLGFSFRPPLDKDWTEEFGKNEVMYTKMTDPGTVSFFVGAVDVQLHGPLPDQKALTGFVRQQKDQWGPDGRYTDVSSSFLPEAAQPSCVRYRMTANDHGAHNRGSHDFLSLHVVGRFCTHPQDPKVAVDIFYSARHIPGYDARQLGAEGEKFLDSLAFDTLPAHPALAADKGYRLR